MHHVLWCEGTIYITAHPASHQYHQEATGWSEQLQHRTSMIVSNITCLLEFCLKSTYFTFQGKHYEQLGGAAMGSPISPIVANLYMENFEVEAINTASHPPYLWKRYVDDTFTIIKSSHRSEFLEHINSIDEHIQFTSEDQREDGSMAFLDILIMPNEDGSLSTTALILMCICNGTVTIQYHPQIVWLAPCTIELKPSAQTPNCCNKKKTIYTEHSQNANTLYGLSIK